MRKLRFVLLALAILLAAAPPRPSAAATCEFSCWAAGNQTCWVDTACRQHCCLNDNPRCLPPC